MLTLSNQAISTRKPVFQIKGFDNGFVAVNRKAEAHDIVYIISGNEFAAFGDKYFGQCFQVAERYVGNEFLPGVLIPMDDTLWMLYDNQYITIEPIKS